MTMPTPLRASPAPASPSPLPQRILVVENSRTHARLIGEAIEQKLKEMHSFYTEVTDLEYAWYLRAV